MPIAHLTEMIYNFTQPVARIGPAPKMNGFANDGGTRPSAAPAQIRRAAFFCAFVSFFGETTEKNDCFSTSP
jgi:hypothetical protein